MWGHGYSYRDRVHGLQDNDEFYARIQRSVPAVWGQAGRPIPVLGFFGSWDAVGKPEVVAQWQEALPQLAASTGVFPGNGHFIEEHRGPEIASGILELTG